MQKRRMIAAGFAAATVLLGGAGAIAVATAMNGPSSQGPAPSDGPDVPGDPDVPEPGDTPDAPPPTAAPTP
jgi:hypothetical protein